VSDQTKLIHLGSSVHDLALAVSELRIAVIEIAKVSSLPDSARQKVDKSIGEVYKHLDAFLTNVRLYTAEPPSA
jgi:hypothetical protein